ncbi:hypothetical protein AB1Y20_013186 [Prymnesium parvum]|uniref:U-box domain-containing protein n=1 Tax=Prymnesium parvum TaxID=97485 RepID=A0AB34IKW4_PRYPA
MAGTPRRVSGVTDAEDPLMRARRRTTMVACALQIMLCVGLVGVAIAQRGRGLALLTMQPFFIGAAVLGFLGASTDRPTAVFAHALGSAGLSLVFALFIFGTTFLQHSDSKPDLWILVINLPMDAYLLLASILSLRLGLAMRRVRRELKAMRERLREELELHEAALSGDIAARRALCSSAAERRAEAGGADGRGGEQAGRRPQGAASSVSKDVCCPISMAVMMDPVIAADGHSYERTYITKWLETHCTSPLTGRVMPSKQLIPNHRLRQIIQSLGYANTQSLL